MNRDDKKLLRQLLQESEAFEHKMERFDEKETRWYIIVLLIVGIGGLFTWPLFSPDSMWYVLLFSLGILLIGGMFMNNSLSPNQKQRRDGRKR